MSSCKRPTHSEYPIVPANQILSSTDDLVRYWNQYMKLGRDFQSLDTNSKSISNRDFLKLLTSGKYLPLRLESGNDSIYYKLYRIDPTVSTDFGEIVTSYSISYYQDYLRRGEKFPDFEYFDLNGNSYTSQSTKGKIIVIKFWFINCPNCVSEMPKCNEVQRKYKNRRDILFLSLAFDSRKKLKEFLLKTKFTMPVIPVKEDYVGQTLKVNSFPKIMVINKKGNIARIFENIDDFEFVAKGL